MRFRLPPMMKKSLALVIGLVSVLVIIGLTVIFWNPINSAIANAIQLFKPPKVEAHEEHDHADEHDHEHDSTDSIVLSPAAMHNIGLNRDTLLPVKLQDFQRTITVPGVVVQRPGRTHLNVPTHFTGLVTEVLIIEGQAVEPGQLLFRIRLTHEDLVNAQTDFLKLLEVRDIEQKEVARLEEVANSGAIPRKTLLEKQYALDKIEGELKAQRQALRLHDISKTQLEVIERERELLQTLSVYAPIPGQKESSPDLTQTSQNSEPARYSSPLIVEQLSVHPGQTVTAGETLCTLADLGELYIEGQAFEHDIPKLNAVMANPEWKVQAILPGAGANTVIEDDLEIVYLANTIDEESRTLHFYVRLPNELINPTGSPSAPQKFLTWKYRLGQRLKLEIPVEEWKNQFVLPVAATAQEGAETFIFVQNGDRFDRLPVRVKFRGSSQVVIENDGRILPNDRIAMRGAHQMQMAIKNQAGGAIDPHAGHNH